MLRAQKFLGELHSGSASGAAPTPTPTPSTMPAATASMPTLCSDTWQLRAIAFSAVPSSHVIKKGVKGCTPGFEIYVNDRRIFISTKELRAKRYVAGGGSAAGGGGGARPQSIVSSSSSAAPGAAADPHASGAAPSAVSVEWTRLETFEINLHGDVHFAFRDVAQEASDAADAGEDAAHSKLGGQRLFHFCFNTAFIGTDVGRPRDSEEATSIG